MLERTQIFVDTSYLLASFYNSWEIGARAQLEIDLPEVVAALGLMVTNQLGQPVHRQLWYDGIPDSGPHRYQRALLTCEGVQLRAGQLIEWGDRRTQKAVDTRLVADMVLAGVRRDFTDLVLVSGDADMIPGVQEAVNAGVRVHLYGFGWDSMSSALRHACDSTTILDPREDFAECMQLEVLEGPLPPVIRMPDNEGPQDNCEAKDSEESPAERAADLGSQRPADTSEPAGAPSPGVIKVAAEKPTLSDVNLSEDELISAARPVAPRPGEVALSAEDCTAERQQTAPSSVPKPGAHRTITVTSTREESLEVSVETETGDADPSASGQQPGETHSGEDSTEHAPAEQAKPTPPSKPTPNPSMMAPRRKLRSRYVPLPNEVWSSAGFQTPFDVGQQYAVWWYENAATSEQRDSAHLLSGGGLPPEIDRPLLQFACETLHEYTLTESQRVSLRDGFHSGIRGVLLSGR